MSIPRSPEGLPFRRDRVRPERIELVIPITIPREREE
jgi:hypothetical protein